MRVAILGGTGKFGRALATRLLEAGDQVVIGSRDADRAGEIAAELGCEGARNEDAVAGVDVAVLAVEASSALETARAIAGALRAPLLSVAAEVDFAGGVAVPVVSGESIAERVAAVLDTPVAAGLHSIAALKLARSRPDEDVLVCGDEEEAKAVSLELAGHVVSGRAVDAGPLSSSRALEAMTAVLLNLNKRYKTHAGLRVTGIQ